MTTLTAAPVPGMGVVASTLVVDVETERRPASVGRVHAKFGTCVGMVSAGNATRFSVGELGLLQVCMLAFLLCIVPFENVIIISSLQHLKHLGVCYGFGSGNLATAAFVPKATVPS